MYFETKVISFFFFFWNLFFNHVLIIFLKSIQFANYTHNKNIFYNDYMITL
jgi:hypothetical protein